MSLQTMNKKWIELNIERYFVEVHHFSSDVFASSASTLNTFVSYCDGKNIRGENARTVDRALEVARYVSNGVKPNDAIKSAWGSYPLVKA